MFEKLDTLESLSTCEGDLLKRKKSIESMLSNHQKPRGNIDVNQNKVVRALQTYKMSDVFALSESSAQINNLCLTNHELQAKWANQLKKIGGYPTETFTSFDKTETCNNFDILKGALLISSLQKYPKISKPAVKLLNKACDLGLYQAFIRRLKSKVDVIKEAVAEATPYDKIKKHVQSALEDASKLSNLYWAAGSVSSAMSLFDIAAYVRKISGYHLDMQRFLHKRNFSWTKYYEATDTPYVVEILKTAVEMLCTSQIIANFPESQKIAMAITNEKGILSGFKAFKTPEELERKLHIVLNKFKIPMPQAFINQAYAAAIRYVQLHYPNYEEIIANKTKRRPQGPQAG